MADSLTCAEYDVYISLRGGVSLVCRLGKTTSIRFNRTLNDFSEATVTVSVDSSCRECVADLNPWQHEVLIFRSKELVWCGPIVALKYMTSTDKVQLHARDLMAWTEKRVIEIANVDGYEVEDVDIAEVFDWVLRHGYDKDPWFMTWAVANTGVPISKYYPGYEPGVDRWGGSYPIVGAELRSLAQAGIDYTVVNRFMYAGDLEINPPISTPLKISDQNWAKSPDIEVNGTSMSTRTIVAGGSGGYWGWYDDQMWIEESTEPWGLLETFTPRSDVDEADTTVLPNAITQEAAARHAILRNPVAFITGGQLSGNSPFSFEQLIPGLPIDVGFARPMRNLETHYRMYDVDVQVDEKGETIDISVSLPGIEDLKT